ncbi:MAG: type II toxin-antitoxin system VapC family toxin [Ignavibacteriae bacterium]|nr:type II toxin-antitoxin system VapC family toxin [Ignavibacteriota bacterium]
MKQSVYIETSVISYLTAKPSRDIIVVAHQQITTEWWSERKNNYRLFVSEIVFQEASKGDVEAASKRMETIKSLEMLSLTENARELTRIIINKGIVPIEHVEDALHIAIASVHEMDYLLTWNCKHIANAEIQKDLKKLVHESGYTLPVLCTPEELLGK